MYLNCPIDSKLKLELFISQNTFSLIVNFTFSMLKFLPDIGLRLVSVTAVWRMLCLSGVIIFCEFLIRLQDSVGNYTNCVFEVINKRFLIPGFTKIGSWTVHEGTSAKLHGTPFAIEVDNFNNRTFTVVTEKVSWLRHS